MEEQSYSSSTCLSFSNFRETKTCSKLSDDRKADDELEELAELLKLPSDVFEIRESQETNIDYTICSHTIVREGTLFGPYSGQIVPIVDDPSLKNSILEAHDKEGRKIHILLRDDSCAWLRIVRIASLPTDANLNVHMDGEEIWCTVSCDIQPDIELRAWYTIRHDNTKYSKSGTLNGRTSCLPSPKSCFLTNHGVEDRKPILSKSSEEGLEISPKELSLVRSEVKDSVHEPTAVLNGDLLKHEPFSPTSSSTSPGSSLEMSSHNDHYSENNIHYSSSGTSNNFSAFPIRLSSSLPSGGHFIYVPFVPQVSGNRTPGSENGGETKPSARYQCVRCGITFSTECTLQAHQTHYCSLRPDAPLECIDVNANTEESKTDTSTELEVQQVEVEVTESSDNRSTKEEKDSGSILKRMPERDSMKHDKMDTKHHKAGKHYPCRHCNYSADKKASLTRHMRIHGSSSPTSECHLNELALRTPPTARYCSNCDIQFSSYKTYHVHKQYYCNTRHVQKSTPMVTNQGTSSTQTDQNVSQASLEHYVHNSIQQSQDKRLSPSQSSNPYNLVLNQPVYAAISTNPLILVPCSYIAGEGVTSGGLIPAGNIIIPSGSPNLHSDGSNANAVSPFAILPGNSSDSKRLSRESCENRTAGRRRELSDQKLCTQERSLLCITQETSPEVTEKPLDLSLRKPLESSPPVTDFEDGDCTKSSISSLPDHQENKNSTRNFQLSPLQPTGSTTQLVVPSALPTGSIPLVPPAGETVPQITSQVLVKQGNSKCKECNIVFYKYENYLVHKKHYCAARQKVRSTSSPEQKVKDETASPLSDIERKEEDSNISASRTKRSCCSTPGETADSRTHSPPLPQPVYQFYCMACGIKFTSLDNLQAHQTYYCPKRDALRGAQSGSSTTLQRQPEFKCSKCKNSYPTEEALKGHPCVVQRKCPYCDVFCPTLSAAQRHLATHTGVKAFRCTICGYKGHTLRGMRTHIRIHLDKGRSTPEESFIVCVDEEGTTIGSPSSRRNSADRHLSESVSAVVELPRSDSASSNVSATPSTGTSEYTAESNSKKYSNSQDKSPEQSNEVTHWCQLCGYSSSYKGNVVRHVKLVHRDRVTTQQVQSTVNSRQIDEVEIKRSDSPITITKIEPDTTENGLSGSEDLTEVPCSANTENSNGGVIVNPQEKTAEQTTKTVGPKYCKACDISFNYLSNFLAHKKFYCTPRTEEVGTQESAQVL